MQPGYFSARLCHRFHCIIGQLFVMAVHLPFFPTGPDGLHVIEKGSPMVQVIPFRREDSAVAADIRAETAAEAASRTAVTRNTRATPGWYRTDARARR